MISVSGGLSSIIVTLNVGMSVLSGKPSGRFMNYSVSHGTRGSTETRAKSLCFSVSCSEMTPNQFEDMETNRTFLKHGQCLIIRLKLGLIS